MAKAKAFKKYCYDALWGDPEALAYLTGRGFKAETVEAFYLGWNKSDLYRDRESWGLSVEKDEAGRKRPLWLPSGVVIPWGDARIRIRRMDTSRINLRYYALPGSCHSTMVISARRPVIPGGVFAVMESELDAMLTWQEAGDLLGAVGLGSVSTRPDTSAAGLLRRAAFILVALDYDKVGPREWAWWRKHFQNAIFWPTPSGKDPGEAFVAGENLRDWLVSGLPDPLRDAIGRKG
jgi:hypothetical protein